jgi:hypothetical protein
MQEHEHGHEHDRMYEIQKTDKAMNRMDHRITDLKIGNHPTS